MIGPLLLAVTALLLAIERRSLRAVGFDRPRARATEFAAGFAAAGAAAALVQLGTSWITGIAWVTNSDVTAGLLVEHTRWTTNSVLFEELVFRGYLLLKAIELIGERRAVMLDAAAFGVYHWFSYGVFGAPAAMIMVFVFTASFGLMLAYAFAATRSVAAPIGLHLGWNAVTYIVFSAGPLGAAMLVPEGRPAMPPLSGPQGFAVQAGIPLTLVAGVLYALARHRTRHAPRS